MVLRYSGRVRDLGPDDLRGFFVGWPAPPDPGMHLHLLRGSDRVVLAVDDDTGRVVDCIIAITDGVLAADIPHLDVLPDWQVQGIGPELVRRMVDRLRDLSMIDLLCDPELQPSSERFGFRRSQGRVIRNSGNQWGRPVT